MLYSSHNFPSLWKMNFYFCAHDGSPHHIRKTHQEPLIYVYKYHPLHRQKRIQNWREFAFAVHGATSSLNDQSPAACSWHFPHERGGFHPKTSSYWSGQYAHSLLDPLFVQEYESDLETETPQILPDSDLNLPQLDVRSLQHQKFPQTAPIIRTQFGSLA